MGFDLLLSLWCIYFQVLTEAVRVGLQSSQRVVLYSYNVCVTIAVAISCK